MCKALRYAMKRKVADGMSGNFRGVCPILNRATVITDTVCAYASCEGQNTAFSMSALAVCLLGSRSEIPAKRFSDFFMENHETHGRV